MNRAIFRRAGLVFLLVGAVAACATGGGYEVAQVGDDFNGMAGSMMRRNYLKVEGGAVASVTLNAVVTSAADTTAHMLGVNYLGSGWIFLGDGESLILLLDGERVALEQLGSPRREVESGRIVQEIAVYPASPDLLRRIATADTVRVRLQGDRGRVDARFTPENTARFQSFVAEHVRP